MQKTAHRRRGICTIREEMKSMSSTSMRKLDKVMIQTENGTKWIHMTDVVQIREEPWLQRFGNWVSLHFKDGSIEYCCTPDFETLAGLFNTFMLIRKIKVRGYRSGKSTSEKNKRSRVTPKKK